MASETSKSIESDSAPLNALQVDQSSRWVVVPLFLVSMVWLTVGLGLGILASIKMHAPGMLADHAWATYGRLRPAYWNVIVYGGLLQGALTAGLWIIARLGRTPLAHPGVALLGGAFWNVGVLAGLVGLLFGGSTGLPGMELPRGSAAFLLGGFFPIALSALYTLRDRRERDLYVSHWFVLAALFAFPWLITGGYLLGVIEPLRGVLRAGVAAWYSGGITYVVLLSLFLAILHYLLPKLCGRQLYSNQTAGLGFWVLVVFGFWSGYAQLAGAPLPSWMPHAGVATKYMLLIVAASVASNWFLTAQEGKAKAAGQPAWSYLSLAFWAFLLGLAADVTGACPAVGKFAYLTTFASGANHLLILGFGSFVVIAAMVYILPHVLNTRWENHGGLRIHVVCLSVGLALFVGGHIFGGLSFGSKLHQTAVSVPDAARGLVPFLGAGTGGMLLMFLGQLVLLLATLRFVYSATADWRSEFCEWCCGCQSNSAGAGKKARASS